MSTKARKYILRSHFSGSPKREDLEIVEETLPPLKDGGLPAIASLAAQCARISSLGRRISLHASIYIQSCLLKHS